MRTFDIPETTEDVEKLEEKIHLNLIESTQMMDLIHPLQLGNHAICFTVRITNLEDGGRNVTVTGLSSSSEEEMAMNPEELEERRAELEATRRELERARDTVSKLKAECREEDDLTTALCGVVQRYYRLANEERH